jgi:hypothetical protein
MPSQERRAAYDATTGTPTPIEAVERIVKAVPWATIAADFDY